MNKKILFVANRDFVLYNFRFELIEKVIQEGFKTYIYLPYGPKVDLMTEAGAMFIPMKIDKRGTNPFKDIFLIRDMKKIFNDIKPDIILLYTTKVDIYGGYLAGKLGISHLINISGLGTAVGEKNFLQKFMIFLYRKSVEKADCVFFQNTRDYEFFGGHNISVRKSELIPGSGVNLDKWKLLPYPDESDGIHFLFIARIIKQKGIEEYLECAKGIKEIYGDKVFFHVIGPCDGKYRKVLEEAEKKSIIIYHGMVQDTSEYLRKAHCLIHPSYYPEGISNVCLEAAASGRPVITTNQPGCRETVEDGLTGYITACCDTEALKQSVIKFMNLSISKRTEMGISGRKKIIKEFNRNSVIDKYIKEIETVLCVE